MTQKKLFGIMIERCADCLMYIDEMCHHPNTKRVIENPSDIPEWCELSDYCTDENIEIDDRIYTDRSDDTYGTR